MNPSRRRTRASNQSKKPTPKQPQPEASPPPPELVQLAGTMLDDAERACKDASQVDPAWGFERRRAHFAHAIRVVCDVERMTEPFGGKDVFTARSRARTIRQAVLDRETFFRQPAPKVPRAPGAAKFLAAVRALAAEQISGRTDSAGIWTAVVVHDVLRGIVHALDDLDRCIDAGKPAHLHLAAWPLRVEPEDRLHR